MAENSTLIARSAFDLLAHEIEHGTQRSVAVLYAALFLGHDFPPGGANRAIIDRWSVRGLERVKKIAWSINEAMCEGQDDG